MTCLFLEAIRLDRLNLTPSKEGEGNLRIIKSYVENFFSPFADARTCAKRPLCSLSPKNCSSRDKFLAVLLRVQNFILAVTTFRRR